MRLVALLTAGFVAASAPASAQYIPRPMAPIGPLPPESVSEIVRHMGLEPVGAPVRSGPVYFQRAADYYGKPLRVVIDAHRAQVVAVEPIGAPPMLHRGPYASAGAPYWRRSYPYGMPDDDAIAPPGSVMTPHGAAAPGRLAAGHTGEAVSEVGGGHSGQPPVPRKRPASAPQQAAGSVEPVQAGLRHHLHPLLRSRRTQRRPRRSRPRTRCRRSLAGVVVFAAMPDGKPVSTFPASLRGIAQKKSAPGIGALPFTTKIEAALGSLGFENLGLRLAVPDRDLARLFRLGDLAHEVDVQETILKLRAGDLDVVGKLEAALERAGRDALIEHLALLLVALLLLLAADREVFSLASIVRSFSEKPATAIEMR